MKDTDKRGLFTLGRIVTTPGALDAMEYAETAGRALLDRHVSGDWGDLGDADKAENVRSVKAGDRLLSAYVLSTGVRVWVMTEADRASTCILLPDEY